jgi:hypothetical protein
MSNHAEAGYNDYSAEIETACASLLWHHPEWLAQFLREHDPQVVFFQPHLRQVVEAVNIAYGEVGLADWPTVVKVVRELDAYRQCGELDGLNEIYSAALPTSLDLDARCFAHYCDMLRRYASARGHQVRLFCFVRGDFILEPNPSKKSDCAPDWVGTGKFSGRLCKALAYRAAGGHLLRLAIYPL